MNEKYFYIDIQQDLTLKKIIKSNLISGNISKETKWSKMDQLSLSQCSVRLTQNSFNLFLQLSSMVYSFLNMHTYHPLIDIRQR